MDEFKFSGVLWRILFRRRMSGQASVDRVD
jgi:hypothetical protein